MKFNPRDYEGFHGNAKRIVDAATTIGSQVVTSPGGGFAGAEIGQTIWVSGRVQETTITAVNSANEVEVADAAVSTGADCECVFGGDDTPVFQEAFADATAIPDLKTTFEVPNARCILTDRFFHYPAGDYPPNLIGEDSGTCIMFVSPNLPVPVDGSGLLINSTGGSNAFDDFTVFCPFSMYTVGAEQAMVRMDGNATRLKRMQVLNFFASDPTSAYVKTFNGTTMIAEGTKVYAAFDAVGSHSIIGAYANRGWIVFNNGGVMIDPYFSNIIAAGLDVSGTPTRMGVGGIAMLQLVGGIFDENGGPEANLNVRDGGAVNVLGTTIWTQATGGNNAARCDGTSRMWLRDGLFSPYAINTSGARALRIDPGGIVRASGTSFRCTSNASDVSILNNGLFVDEGGNDFGQNFPGPNPTAVLQRDALANPTSNIRIANQRGS